jgi:hypothetical protein
MNKKTRRRQVWIPPSYLDAPSAPRYQLKEIIKKGWDVFPPWLMALNIFAIIFGLGIILFL